MKLIKRFKRYFNNKILPLVARIFARFGFKKTAQEKVIWKAGTKSEAVFWEDWINSKGGPYPEDFQKRMDPESKLQPELVELLPSSKEVSILDVGAGPLTLIGKKHPGKKINVTAIDSLADDYNKSLRKFGIEPIVRTEKCDAEKLHEEFEPNSFDIITVINALDHVYNPEKAILSMLKIVKTNGYIFLRHTANEAEEQNYSGLHQWNLSLSDKGEFLIRSKSQTINMNEKYKDICQIYSKMVVLLGKNKIQTVIEKISHLY